MGEAVKKADYKFTYADYCSWPDDERWEIIDGIAYNMSPAPSVNHQRISRVLLVKFDGYLKNKKCEVFAAPFDVFFPDSKDQDINTVTSVVQPDITVICDPVKLIKRGCFGAPDIAVEILSPWTSPKDHNQKFSLYESNGVMEYWVIDPETQYIRIFNLDNTGKYDSGRLTLYNSYQKDEKTFSLVLEGFEIQLKKLFPEMS